MKYPKLKIRIEPLVSITFGCSPINEDDKRLREYIKMRVETEVSRILIDQHVESQCLRMAEYEAEQVKIKDQENLL